MISKAITGNKWVMSLILGVPLSGLISFAVWALDTRYITHTDLNLSVKQQYVQRLSDQVDQLILKKQLGLATEFDKALLEQLKQKLSREKNN